MSVPIDRHVLFGSYTWTFTDVPPSDASAGDVTAHLDGELPESGEQLSAPMSPAVVLLHGVGSDHHTWSHIVEALASEYRVIALDLPGYALGATHEVPDIDQLALAVDEFLDFIGVNHYLLVGHSFGGAVAMTMAYCYPRQCQGLVLIDSGGFGPEINPLMPLLGTRSGTAALGLLHRKRLSRSIHRIADRLAVRDEPHPQTRIDELMETYERLATRRARVQLRRSVRASLRTNSAAGRQRVAAMWPDLPILVLWGSQDRVLPPWHAQRAQELLPWAQVQMIDGAGHTPHRTHPDEVTAAILAFVQGLATH